MIALYYNVSKALVLVMGALAYYSDAFVPPCTVHTHTGPRKFAGEGSHVHTEFSLRVKSIDTLSHSRRTKPPVLASVAFGTFWNMWKRGSDLG